MAGAAQAPSTEFDPAPQFAIHAIQSVDDGRLIATGRCWFEPVTVGSVFTRVAVRGDGGWTVLGPCRLELESIALYHLYVDRLDQTHSARVWFVGASEHLAEAGQHDGRLLLVGDAPANTDWAWDGRLWTRPAPGPLP